MRTPSDGSGVNTPGSPTSSNALDRARRDWLQGLVEAHAMRGDAQTALDLAQGYWRCGEYALAWPRFVEARDAAPDQAGSHLALVHAASMLARWEEERDALDRALVLHPDDARVALAAARAWIPDARPRARDQLLRFPGDTLCAAFLHALDSVEAGTPPTAAPGAQASAELAARFSGLEWACAHAPGPDIHVGIPTRVLDRALDAARLPGLVLECGVYFGRSLQMIAHRTGQAVHGFDSFQGLPEAWKPGEGAGAYSTAGRLPTVPANASLHVGWFDQTLPAFLDTSPAPIRLLHVDCDIYSSTRTVLDALADRLQPGSVIVFDDMLGYPGYEAHELRAFEEFVAATDARWELLAACLLGREVAVRITGR